MARDQHFVGLVPTIRYVAVAAAMREGASAEDAQEIAQIVLFGLWRSEATGDMPDKPLAWARVVAKRQAWHNARLRQTREATLALGDLTDVIEIATDDSTDDFLEVDRVLNLISSLPAEQGKVMALSMDGASVAEIAGDLQISPSLARVRLRAAREKLRAAIVDQMAADRRAEKAEQRVPERRSRSTIRPKDASTIPREETDITTLPPRQQEVIRLSRSGYKPAQIARVLAISPNTVRVNLYHARKRIRQAAEAT